MDMDKQNGQNGQLTKLVLKWSSVSYCYFRLAWNLTKERGTLWSFDRKGDGDDTFCYCKRLCHYQNFTFQTLYKEGWGKEVIIWDSTPPDRPLLLPEFALLHLWQRNGEVEVIRPKQLAEKGVEELKKILKP